MVIVRNDIIPFKGKKALTLWPFIFARKEARINEVTINHEQIHGRQQVELLMVGFVIAILLVLVGLGWWSILALPLFFWLYLLEWLLGLIRFGNSKKAYRSISFEQEAYTNENNMHYLHERRWFAWIDYLF